MRERLAAAVAASFLIGASGPQGESPAATPPGATVTTLTRSATTVTGQPVRLPQGPVEVVVSVSELPAGGRLAMHKHPWPRFAYVERGRLRVRWEAAGLEREFGPGEAVIEAIDQWHEGEVIGAEPVRLIVIDQLPPGETNLVRR